MIQYHGKHLVEISRRYLYNGPHSNNSLIRDRFRAQKRGSRARGARDSSAFTRLMGSSECEWRVTSVGSALPPLLSQHTRLPRQTSSSSPLPMQTTRVTRSSVLGKRGHQQQQESSSLPSKSADRLQTPDSTPLSKRPRVSTLTIDGDGNKENIPPFSSRLLTPDPSPTTTRTSRSLRRSGTENISPSRAKHGTHLHIKYRFHCSEVIASNSSLRVNVNYRVS